MSIKLLNNSLTIDTGTKLYFKPNSGEGKIATTSDSLGTVLYGASTLSNKSDEELPVSTSINTSSDSYQIGAPKNNTYIVKANFNWSPSSETEIFIEISGQATTTGDKIRILDLTLGGNGIIITSLTFLGQGVQPTTGPWITLANYYQLSILNTKLGTYPPVYNGYDQVYLGNAQNTLTQYTLLYSPVGIGKNGSRMTIVLPPTGSSVTYNSTDYVWYRTKATHNQLDEHLSTGTPPSPAPINPDPFPIDPNPNPFPFPGPGGDGF
jgi:hypothetical protein